MSQTSEEVRKIQFTGKSTYIISLPKKWVTSLGLKAGSQVTVSQQNDSLIINPKDSAETPLQPTYATITISDKDNLDMITRKIISLYLVGYNLITVKTRSERISGLQRNAVKELTKKKLVGTEIIAESPSEIKLQILLSYPELSIENALRRMCLIAKSMHEDAIQALKDLNKKLAQEVIQSDDEVDRFSFYIIRQLKAAVQNNKILRDIGLANPRDCLGYRVIVKFVERIADHATKIAENTILLKEKPDPNIFQKLSEMSTFAKSIFEYSITSLFKKDYALADNAILKAKEIVKLESEALKLFTQKTEQTSTPILRIITESIRRTAEYSSDIAEIVLNLNINQIIRNNV